MQVEEINFKYFGSKKERKPLDNLTPAFLALRVLSQRLPGNNSICFSGGHWHAKTGCFCCFFSTRYDTLLRDTPVKKIQTASIIYLATLQKGSFSLLVPILLVQPAMRYPPTAPDTVSSGQGLVIEGDASAIAAAEAGIRSPGYVSPEHKNSNSRIEGSKGKTISLRMSLEGS